MSEKQPTKQEMQARDEFDAQRQAKYQHDLDLTHSMGDPMTDPSAGDPPAAVTDHGERLGTVPVTRNAVADMAQAEQEGLDAAKNDEPSKAEKASARPPRASAADAERGKTKMNA